ncbi:Hint domain-containing protein [Bombella sp. TMW 2.2543]|uniref:Hint domain-containing protein n=1 Tax=Bombella pluederhausensis TaxID=2967336 RepID=A0ABT3WHG4_9PROT|nr:Hint domain-containing protein [Bombella pluederhausensis]MCX5618552.1 Hint domain-containing protein [Bombella pluederhausensis]
MIIPFGQTVNWFPQSRQAIIQATLFMPDNLPSFSGDNSFNLQGGTLVISPASWQGLVSPAALATPHTLTINPGKGGTLLVDYEGLSSTVLPTNLSLTLHLTVTPPPSFKIKLAFSTQSNSSTAARQRYDAQYNQTTIQLNEDYSVSSTAHTTILIPGNPYHLPLDGNWCAISLSDAGSAKSSAPELVCYLPGTLIDTPNGPMKVEELRPGDAIHSFQNHQKRVEHLRWVGYKSVTAASPDDWPIRIKPHTFGKNCPFQDLYITEEHCLYLKGAFIPARMLVNHSTITREERTCFDIHHVETYEHRIISANGVLSETYLNTGNRGSFITPDTGTIIHSGPAFPDRIKDWHHDAAAPLRVDRTFVEPIHTALTRRAEKLGVPADTPNHHLTDDPALRLLDPQGSELPLLRKDGSHYLFQMQGAVPFLSITSRTARPSESIGPFVDDRRLLGVLVGSIILIHPEGQQQPLTSHLTAPSNTGWDVMEASPCRWTNGQAHLPLPNITMPEGSLLEIEVLSAGPYILPQ